MTGRRQHCFALPGLRPLMLATLAAASLASVGCVHRRMSIATDPPGAQVLLDGEEAGTTPLSVDFTYYGTREVTLRMDGYETQTIMQKVRTPWYQWFPLEVVSDNFLPFKVANRHQFLYRMQPRKQQPEGEFLNRGSALRSESHVGP